MLSHKLIVFQGPESQTGIAFSKEFKQFKKIDDSELSFDDIRELIIKEQLITVLPIWNSHAGEVTKSHVLSMLFNEEGSLYYLWPEEIVFKCLKRKKSNPKGKKLISVHVAKHQCSDFIESNGYVFIPSGSTKEAHKVFKSDDSYEAALCAPSADNAGFGIESHNASNPLNFTTFAVLGDVMTEGMEKTGCLDFTANFFDGNRFFSAIEVPLYDDFSDSQERLFDELIEDAGEIDDVPKVLFVAKSGSRCRMLVESNEGFAPTEALGEEGREEDILILQNVGRSSKEYSKRIEAFLRKNVVLSSQDFIKHEGAQTCFFACPALGILTHGYESEATEIIVRQVIRKCFDLLRRLSASEESNAAEKLYFKYRKEYQESGIDFIKFEKLIP